MIAWNPVLVAALENAEWCDAMCRSHGMAGAFDAAMWTSPVRTPLLYPDAVTLSPDASAELILDRIDCGTPGATIKDSFADLDLSGAGFRVLFDAQWIYRAAGPVATSQRPWRRVTEPGDLADWAVAWDRDRLSDSIFRPELLKDDAVAVLGRWDADRLVAGAVAHRSASVVGVSNLFHSDIGVDDAWTGCLATVARLWPGHPVVGYEQGEDLAAPLRAGFETLGPLRVWSAA
ncbi:hypothetical protein [Nocardia sp. NPDC052566]|uniref:hypothetical protein n=1 Tax=Nocardia sp. NPDC052566 TaxID=3364330 RepID=UPI0037C5A979